MVSAVWNCYDLVEGYANCKHCVVKIKYCGNTTNLWNHVKVKHPQLQTSDTRQPKIDQSIKEIESVKGGEKKKQIETKLVQFIVSDFQPFSVVESDGFKELIHACLPQFTVPSRKTITKLIHDVFLRKKELIKVHLKTIPHISISCDLWTDSLNSYSYLGLTGHYIDDYKSTSLCLAVKQLNQSHTGDNIADKIKEILEDYEIEPDKLVSMVCDGAANMMHAAKQLVKRPIWCVAHRLNLIVNDAINDITPIVELVHRIRMIVKLFKQSNNFNDTLMNLQIQDNKSPLKLLQDVCTRWNSTYIMIERYMKLREFVSMALVKIGKQSMDINCDNVIELNDIKLLLLPFFKVTEDVSGEKYVTISRIIPVINMLKDKVLNLKVKSDLGNRLQGVLCSKIDQRFGPIEGERNFAYATMLDPRFKRVDFMSPTHCSAAYNEIESMLPTVPLTQPIFNTGENNNDENDDLWDLHEKRRKLQSDQSVGRNSGFKHYMSMPTLGLTDDPLYFWKINKDNWHELHNLAIRFLTSPATSVPCERLFSKVGNIVTEKRSRLSPKHIEMICFLKYLPDCFKD